MIEPHRHYRKFRVIVDFFDDETNTIVSAKQTLDLGSVQDFEELVNPNYTDGIKRIFVRFNVPVSAKIFRMSYEEFDSIFSEYLRQEGRLDERSVKKKLNYKGPVDIYFHPYERGVIFTMYPKGFSFQLATPMEATDAMLNHIITPYN